jgi:hypothetical protein
MADCDMKDEQTACNGSTRRIAYGMCEQAIKDRLYLATRHVVTICEAHQREVWDRMGPLCVVGYGHWTHLSEQGDAR